MSGNLRATGLEITGSADISSDLRVTGSLQVNGDISVASGQRIYFNGDSGDVSMYSTNGNNIFIDADDLAFIDFDTNLGFRYSGQTLFSINDTAIFFNSAKANRDFYVNGDSNYGTFLIDSTDESIILGHEEFDSSPAASETPGYGADVKIMLSGSASSKDSSTRGLVLVPGDMLVSGSLHIGGKGNNNEASIKSGRHPSQTSFTIWESETAAYNQIRLKNGVHQTQLTNGGFTINSDAEDVNFTYHFPGWDYAISGDAGNKTLSFGRGNPPGNDQFFFVSGAIGLKDTAVKGLAVFGGDVLISGSILNSNGVTTAGQKSEIRKNNVFNLASSTSELFFPGSDGEASSGTLNPQRAFLAPYSGSIKKIVIRIQVTNTDPVYRFYKNLNDGEANIIGYFTGSHGNNEVIEYDIDQQTKVIKGGGGSSAITVNGNFNFDPGDLLSISYQGQGGSTPGYANTCIFIEYDTTSIIE